MFAQVVMTPKRVMLTETQSRHTRNKTADIPQGQAPMKRGGHQRETCAISHMRMGP